MSRCEKLLVGRKVNDGTTITEVVQRVVNTGLWQLEYRQKQNNTEKRREERRVMKMVQADPELAVKCGLAHKS
jgi:hypothetical protein